jgi:hypothetical protein
VYTYWDLESRVGENSMRCVPLSAFVWAAVWSCGMWKVVASTLPLDPMMSWRYALCVSDASAGAGGVGGVACFVGRPHGEVGDPQGHRSVLGLQKGLVVYSSCCTRQGAVGYVHVRPSGLAKEKWLA